MSNGLDPDSLSPDLGSKLLQRYRQTTKLPLARKELHITYYLIIHILFSQHHHIYEVLININKGHISS